MIVLGHLYIPCATCKVYVLQSAWAFSSGYGQSSAGVQKLYSRNTPSPLSCFIANDTAWNWARQVSAALICSFVWNSVFPVTLYVSSFELKSSNTRHLFPSAATVPINLQGFYPII